MKDPVLTTIGIVLAILISSGIATTCIKHEDAEKNWSKWSEAQPSNHWGEYVQFRTNLTTGKIESHAIIPQ